MNSVLFVDDERLVLDGLENMLFDYMDDWEMEFVESGAEALEFLEDNPVDVIVTDMRMPGMDGSALLAKVKERHPRIVRVVLSGHAELDAAMRAISLAHRYLSKPCSPDTLISVLQRVVDLNRLISNDALLETIGDVDQLPARPTIYTQLAQITSSPDFSSKDIISLIEQDVGIATKIIKTANSPIFSRANRVNSVRDAVLRLGALTIRDLVLGLETYRHQDLPIDIEHLHCKAQVVASVAKKIAPEDQVSDAFLAGLVHDIGLVVQAVSCPDRYASVESEMENRGIPRVEAELEEYGHTHAEMGAYLLGLWGLPTDVVEAVCHHHTPNRPQHNEFCSMSAVYVASTLCSEVLSERPAAPIDMNYLERIGVSERLDDWRQLVVETIQNAGLADRTSN